MDKRSILNVGKLFSAGPRMFFFSIIPETSSNHLWSSNKLWINIGARNHFIQGWWFCLSHCRLISRRRSSQNIIILPLLNYDPGSPFKSSPFRRINATFVHQSRIALLLRYSLSLQRHTTHPSIFSSANILYASPNMPQCRMNLNSIRAIKLKSQP